MYYVCPCVFFLFFGDRKKAPPSMVTGGPPCRWTRVHRKATANRTQRAPRPRNAATTKPKKERREHSHRLVPTWCVAEEVLGEGWRCGCNPRSCRAVVEKSGQRPPVGAPPDENTVTGLRHVVCCPWTARGDLSSPHGPMSAPTHELKPWGVYVCTYIL